MNYKALALGAVVGFLFALSPSCGQEPQECGPSNCAGCCSADGECIDVATQNATLCGASGNACAACAPNQACNAGTCIPVGTPNDAGTDGGGNDLCNPSNCLGCCTASGSCRTGNSSLACGTGGVACQACPSGEVCQSGQCVTPPDAGVANTGAACASDDDCTHDNTCRTATASGNAMYEGGYCTKACGSATGVMCGTESICVNLSPYGEDPICAQKCDPQLDNCRMPGYGCYGLQGSNDGVCWIVPTPSRDAGPPPPPNLVGSDCTVNEDCQADGGFEAGGCLVGALADGGPTGFTNGYCTADCGLVDCNDTTDICIDFGDPGLFCTKKCDNGGAGQDTCNTDEVCEQYGFTDGGLSSDGFCWPSCHAPGWGCPSGAVCNLLGYCEPAPADAGTP